jgi:ABC-type glycerol-3-phosphate transport system permease component
MSGDSVREIPAKLTLISLLGLTMAPLVLMVMLSVKSNADIYSNFWGVPSVIHWEHYTLAWNATRGYLWNTMTVTVISTIGILFFSSLAGYVFARHEFPGRDLLFTGILALMMIPGIMTLTPLFLLVKDLGLLNSHWALILPYIAGGQMLGIFLCRSFIAEISKELVEAARIDGAGEFTIYLHVVLPLLKPVLATIGIMQFFAIYNDFIWPLITISDNRLQVFTVALMIFGAEHSLDMGPQLAGYVIGCIPLVILIAFGMKSFVAGTTAGAIKS